MRKEIIETGKTVDAAIDSACEKLGCPRDDCEWEIIDLPKKGFLGIKNIPAKVRVSVEIPDEKPVKREQRPEPKRAEPKEKPERQVQSERQTQPERQAQPERHAPARQERQPKRETAEKEPQAPPKQRRENAVQPDRVQPDRVQPERGRQEQFLQREQSFRREQSLQREQSLRRESIKPDELSEKEIIARDYIDAVIREMGLNAEYTVTHEHGGTCINITGKGLGAVIGRRGETLDAIQYLTGLAANRGDGEYLRLTVDCGDYRLKRKDTLEALAKKLADQVLKTNVSKTLEPMNPFERRIIHATVSEIEGVSSSSIGEEPNRRVVITSPTARPALKSDFRSSDFRSGESRPGGFRSGGERGGRDTRGPRRDPRRAADGDGSQERTAGGGFRGGRNERDSRDNRDRRGGRGAKPVPPQGPPKQTPESEVTQGVKFGKIDL